MPRHLVLATREPGAADGHSRDCDPVIDLMPRGRRAPHGINLAPIQEGLMNQARQVGVNVGSPGRSRTCDILINSESQERTEHTPEELRPREPEGRP